MSKNIRNSNNYIVGPQGPTGPAGANGTNGSDGLVVAIQSQRGSDNQSLIQGIYQSTSTLPIRGLDCVDGTISISVAGDNNALNLSATSSSISSSGGSYSLVNNSSPPIIKGLNAESNISINDYGYALGISCTGGITGPQGPTGPAGSTYNAIAPVSPSDNNGIIVDNSFYQIKMEFADNTNGILSDTTQNIAGDKNFNGNVNINYPYTLYSNYIEAPLGGSGILSIGGTTSSGMNIGRAGTGIPVSIISDRLSVDQGVIDSTNTNPINLGTVYAGGVNLGRAGYNNVSNGPFQTNSIDTPSAGTLFIAPTNCNLIDGNNIRLTNFGLNIRHDSDYTSVWSSPYLVPHTLTAIGNMITLSVPTTSILCSGGSDSIFTMNTPIPVEYRPNIDQYSTITVENGSNTIQGTVAVRTSGVIQIGTLTVSSIIGNLNNFSNISSTYAGWLSYSFTYPLNVYT